MAWAAIADVTDSNTNVVLDTTCMFAVQGADYCARGAGRCCSQHDLHLVAATKCMWLLEQGNDRDEAGHETDMAQATTAEDVSCTGARQ